MDTISYSVITFPTKTPKHHICNVIIFGSNCKSYNLVRSVRNQYVQLTNKCFRIVSSWLKNVVSSCNSVRTKSEKRKHQIAKHKEPNNVDIESEKKTLNYKAHKTN